MEPIESSETSAYNNTLRPGTYPKEKKLHMYIHYKLLHRLPVRFLPKPLRILLPPSEGKYAFKINVINDQQDATILDYLFIPNQLYIFRALYSPIIIGEQYQKL